MKREDFNNFYRLLPKQKWLAQKEDAFTELLNLCEHKLQKDLVFELLNDFFYVDSELLNFYINKVAKYITLDSGFTLDNTLIVGMAWDKEPDSSQWVLHLIRTFLFDYGWNNVEFADTVPQAVRVLNKGKHNQVILLDEFIGSGKTAKSRVEYMRKNSKSTFEIKACFVAGMKFGVDCFSKYVDEIFCPIILSRGISDKYKGVQKISAIKAMHQLECKLLKKINKKELKEYKFGYSKTQALYSSHANIPNSVFPVFWWPLDDTANRRNLLLKRNEKGF